MASKTTSQLKADWIEMSDECFETLTFGELKIYQKFIALPLPGDNSGHGGFKGAHYVFTKFRENIDGFSIPTGTARDNRGVLSSYPHSMPVILLK